MDYRITWVHGVGQEQAGYSQPWEHAFNQYLQLPDSDYSEVLWSVVFNTLMRVSSLIESTASDSLTAQEQFAEADLTRILTTILQARIASQAQPDVVGEWTTLRGNTAVAERIALPVWLQYPDQYIGEFVKYLVNRPIRNAVKEKMKQQMRILATSQAACSVIAHSWGTVVAYESLIDLEVELPGFQLANLFTLGSPLWMVAPFLDERSGRKPHTVGRWVNVHAQGDPVGCWLKPGFAVDQDYAVANFGGGDAHGSYFLPGNAPVQRDIVAVDIL